jgi:hypothetical protein
MTTYSSDFVAGVIEALKYGQQLRIKYYNTFFTGDYDDDITLTQSGTDLWISGVILPINQSRGSNDAMLLEQGKLFTNDTKLYIEGTVNTSGTIKIGLGSPVYGEYSLLSDGVIKYTVNQVDILKKIYLRFLTNGSLIGE